MDRIIKVAITFADGVGQTKTRVYTVDPASTFITANNPQGKCLGYINVKGPVWSYEDTKVNE